MGFVKYASVQSLGAASYSPDADGLQKVAQKAEHEGKSYYIDGARKLDVKACLNKVAERYNISKDPANYLFEAIRANTVNVPNENHDAFHKNELLRFDTRYASPFGDMVGAPVYMTYAGKPHHLNHKTDDASRARGVILDAHYNDESPALEFCPQCNTRTAEAANRDQSGIHCAKCASVVKDEFIEILVAVDTEKDPALARGIQAGILNAGSMGCNCASTVCNVCHKVAHSVNEFCEHIKGAAKGTLWARKGSKFERISPDAVRKLLRDANYSAKGYQGDDGFKLVAVSLVIPELDFECRRAFEFCQGVEFDEYSRVYRPADPKARTVEILKAAQSEAELSLEQETEQLLIRARLAQKGASLAQEGILMGKAASANMHKFYAVRVNGNDEDIHVSGSLREAVKTAQLGRRDRADYLVVEATSHKAALVRAIQASLTKTAQFLPMDADVQLVVPDGMQVVLDESGSPMLEPGQPGQPGQPGDEVVQPPAPQSIEDVTQQEIAPEDMQQSPEEFGMLPPGASAEGAETSDMAPSDLDIHAEGEEDEYPDGYQKEFDYMKENKYAAVYGDFEVEVFSDHAVLFAPGGEVFSAKTAKKLATDDAKRSFGASLVDSLLNDGLVRTAKKYAAQFSKRLADGTEGAMFDMAEKPPMEGGGALAGAASDMKEARPSNREVSMGAATERGYDDDMKGENRPMPSNSVESRNTDLEEEAKEWSPSSSATDGSDDDMEDSRPGYSLKNDSLEGANFDMKVKHAAKQAEDRVKKLYSARTARLKEAHQKEMEARVAAEREKVFRALRIAAQRFALNHETSPLKATVVDSLTVPRTVGICASTGQELEFGGMGDSLALHLVEAAWEGASADETEALIERTAELLGYDDKYLVSAEADLKKQAAIIPSIVSEEQTLPATEAQHKSASMRKSASDGNFTLSPRAADGGGSEDAAAQIRAALGPTKVSRMLSNEEIRPSF